MGGVSPTQQRRRSSSGVYSPLMVSADASNVQHREKGGNGSEKVSRLSQQRLTSSKLEVSEGDSKKKRWSLRDERARRQLFALSADGKVGSRESAYMGWTQLPQLGQIRQRWEKEAGEGVRRRVENLLSPPRLMGTQIPLEFRGLQTQEPGRLSVWTQKVCHDMSTELFNASTRLYYVAVYNGALISVKLPACTLLAWIRATLC